MNYLEISHCNMVNGEGLRCVLWVAGCSHKCAGCQNQFSQDPKLGVLFDKKAKEEIFNELKQDWCTGLTFSGGDPLYSENRKTIIDFAKEVKEKFPSKNIWLYTGYYLNEIKSDKSMSDILKYVDVVCDGPFIEGKKDINLHWVGSSNQNVIFLNKK